MSARSGPPPTPHGHDLYEARSALQKSVRRGLEDDALYWAAQIETAGCGQYVWRSLKVMAHEDVGLANPDALVQVIACHEAAEELRKLKKEDQLLNQRAYMAMAVMILARSPKSRLVDDAVTVTWAEAEDPEFKREVPDYALDRHTAQGRRLGRGWEHFFEEGCRIERAAEGIGGTGSGQPDEENPYAKRLKRVFEKKANRGGAMTKKPPFEWIELLVDVERVIEKVGARWDRPARILVPETVDHLKPEHREMVKDPEAWRFVTTVMAEKGWRIDVEEDGALLFRPPGPLTPPSPIQSGLN